MTQETKLNIVDQLRTLSMIEGSQAKLAIRAGMKASMLSDMLNGKWDLIKNEQFRKVQTNLHIELDWKTCVSTKNFEETISFLRSVKKKRLTACIADNAGKGKSEAYKYFKKTTKNVLYIECKKIWTKKGFLKNVLRQAGIVASGTCEQMYEQLTEVLKMKEDYTIIIDQMDKLCDPSFDIFMDLYNDLRIYVSFLLSGTERLEKRIKNGVKRKKEGYAEIYSRIGKSFIKVGSVSKWDVKKICEANGLTDKMAITEIYNLSKDDITREVDLRVVRLKVEKYFEQQYQQQAA